MGKTLNIPSPTNSILDLELLTYTWSEIEGRQFTKFTKLQHFIVTIEIFQYCKSDTIKND